MSHDPHIPASGGYRLTNARVPGVALGKPGTDLTDIAIAVGDNGRIEIIEEARGGEGIDLAGRVVLPAFVDVHTHLDKGHIWPRRPNPDGSFVGALDAVATDRAANWSAADVAARMDFALRAAYAQGTKAIRTHIDSVAPQHRISWPVFAEMKEKWDSRIALQATPLYAIDHVLDALFMDEIASFVTASGAALGAVTYMVPELDEGLEALFRLASDNGFDLDFHVDETDDPRAVSLTHIAKTARTFGFAGRILCGHCCSLARQPDDDVDRTLDLLAETGIAVVSLPMCNMYLQDRHEGRTPRWRGVTLVHEMRARGIPVMVASDNTRDPFYAYGDLDPWEVYRAATRTLHLDHPVGDWIETITTVPTEIMGLSDGGRLAAGASADFVIMRGRSWSEVLSRSEHQRIVVRAGRAIDTTLPDYAELDPIVGSPAGP